MRFFYLLVAVLVARLDAKNRRADVTKYQLPNGLPNGSILTFYFWHKGGGEEGSHAESVKINFYEQTDIPIDEVYDILAHIRIDRDLTYPVVTNTYVDGNWMTQTRTEQPLDELPPTNGWWRVDVIKHDYYNLNVFFQGFWSDVRTFKRSVDDAQSIYVISDYVDHKSVHISIKIPNGVVAPLSVADFKSFLYGENLNGKQLVSFGRFPIGAHMEMTTVLRASAGAKYKHPELIFSPTDGSAPFLSIQQRWDGTTEELLITDGKGNGMHCTNMIPHGDLQHFYLERVNPYRLKMQVFYKPDRGVKGVTCQYPFLHDEELAQIEKPFNIVSRDGALIFHLDHSIPRSVVINKDE